MKHIIAILALVSTWTVQGQLVDPCMTPSVYKAQDMYREFLDVLYSPLLSTTEICMDFKGLACCMNQLKTSCPEAQSVVQGIVEGLAITLQTTPNATTSGVVCGLPDSDLMSTACNVGTCTYTAMSGCAATAFTRIGNDFSKFQASLYAMLVSTNQSYCELYNGVACCLKETVSQCPYMTKIINTGISELYYMILGREIAPAYISSDTAPLLCGGLNASNLAATAPVGCVCPAGSNSTNPNPNTNTITPCNSAMNYVMYISDCYYSGNYSFAPGSTDAASLTQHYTQYCANIVPQVNQCMMNRYSGCPSRTTQISAYAATFRSHACTGTAVSEKISNAINDLVTAMTTPNTECQLSMNNDNMLKPCGEPFSDILSTGTYQNLANSDMDSFINEMSSAYDVLFKCIKNTLLNKCGKNIVNGVMAFFRTGLLWGITIDEEVASPSFPIINIKASVRISLKLFGAGHTKTSLGTWKSCNYGVSWSVLFQNRFMKMEGKALSVKAGNQAAMFTEIKISFADSDVNYLTDVTALKKTFSTGLTTVDGSELGISIKIISSNTIRIKFDGSGIAIYISRWKKWYTGITIRGAKELFDKDSSGDMMSGCSTPRQLRRKRAVTEEECATACTGSPSEFQSFCASDCFLSGDITFVDAAKETVVVDGDAESLDDILGNSEGESESGTAGLFYSVSTFLIAAILSVL